MTRRASLPGADELFRPTGEDQTSPDPAPAPTAANGSVLPEPGVQPFDAGGRERESKPRHEEKVTFYCTASELNRLERVRLTLRTDHRVASDRGRIVRAALAEILDDFEANGPSSALLRRLGER